MVLFSAAVPNQSGEHHINCQWPAYWADLFAQRGYVVVDALRFLIWEDDAVDWWYRQNIMIYACAEQLERWPKLETLHRSSPARPLPLVHAEMSRDLLIWSEEQEKNYWELFAATSAIAKK